MPMAAATCERIMRRAYFSMTRRCASRASARRVCWRGSELLTFPLKRRKAHLRDWVWAFLVLLQRLRAATRNR